MMAVRRAELKQTPFVAVVDLQITECIMDIVRIIIAILLPPLGVFLQVGLKWPFWINIILTILGYIPGIVHAVWIIARRS